MITSVTGEGHFRNSAYSMMSSLTLTVPHSRWVPDLALAAIQGLNQKLEEQLRQRDAQLASQQQRITELLQRLGFLEQKLNTPETK